MNVIIALKGTHFFRIKKHWALNYILSTSEDSDQTGRMPRLIWFFAGCTCHFVGFVVRRLIYKHVLEGTDVGVLWSKVVEETRVPGGNHPPSMGDHYFLMIVTGSKTSLQISWIGFIWKMSTLKPVHLSLWNCTHFMIFTKLKNAENLNLISWLVLEL